MTHNLFKMAKFHVDMQLLAVNVQPIAK